MVKSVKGRLESLANSITSIGNFNYASEYGNTERGVRSLLRQVNQDLPAIEGIESSTYPIVQVNSDLISDDLDVSKLSIWEREVEKRLRELRSDSNYKALLKAYNKDDQKEIADLLPFVFTNEGLDEIIVPSGNLPRLYHGVTIPEGFDSQDYVDLCLRIQKQGLKPSPFGLHCEMDRRIRPVYSAITPLGAHGLISFSFIPDGYTVVMGKGEARVYTKRLKTDFDLNLRHPETLISYAPGDNIGIPSEIVQDYHAEVKDILKQRRIDFNELQIPSD